MAPARVNAPPASAVSPKPELQVCGIVDPIRSAADAADIDHHIADATHEAYEHLKAALLGGSDVRARAMGLWLQRRDDFFAGSLAADTSLDQLVELAVTARDPVVYGAAVGACKTGPTDDTSAACQRLSLSEWTKIDPDNALPWLATAAAARANGDSWAESSAFARAAQTHKVEDSGESLLGVALGALPADVRGFVRASLEIQLAGIAAGQVQPLAEIRRFCSETALQQSQIHDQCAAMAELLVDHGGTLLNFSLGRAVGQSVGWPAAKLDQLAREKDALLRLTALDGGQAWSCSAMARRDEFLTRRSQIGELAALRELRDKSEQTDQPSR